MGSKSPEIPSSIDVSNLLSVSLYIKLTFAPLISKPAPSACPEFDAFEAKTILRSLISTTVELIVVVVPLTSKSPRIITFPVISPSPEGSIINSEGTLKV
jgi:hypothetical protein